MYVSLLQFEAEFRRFSLSRSVRLSFDEFYNIIEKLHNLRKLPFLVTYTDREGDLLPINNNENFHKALATARPILRLCIQRKGNVVMIVCIFCILQWIHVPFRLYECVLQAFRLFDLPLLSLYLCSYACNFSCILIPTVTYFACLCVYMLMDFSVFTYVIRLTRACTHMGK